MQEKTQEPFEPEAPVSPENLPSGVPEQEIKPGKPPKKQPGIGIRLLRWALGLLIIFGLGALLVIYLFVLPLRQQASARQADLNAANQQIAELESQVDSFSSLGSKNEAIQTDLEQANLHIAVLSARADVAAAQLALAKKDPAKARVALNKTPQTLEKMLSQMPADQKKVVTDMQARLKLAVSEIEANPYAADSDLNVLGTSLLEMENAYFTKP